MIPKNVNWINWKAFDYCSNLKKIILPEDAEISTWELKKALPHINNRDDIQFIRSNLEVYKYIQKFL